MHLEAHMDTGERPITDGNISSYAGALAKASARLRSFPHIRQLYLIADNSTRVMRTYRRNPSKALYGLDVLSGFHEWPEPPTMYPGSLPGPATTYPGGFFGWPTVIDPVAFSADEIGAMLERQDRKGYERGFKVGISHRNRERAAQLREQADSLERAAPFLSPTGRMSFKGLYPYQEGAVKFAMQGRSMGKTWSLEEAHQARDRLRRHGLPGSVRAGVYGDVRTLGAGDPAHPEPYDYSAGDDRHR